MNEKLFKIFLLQFQKYVVVVVVVRCQHSNARFKLGNSVQWQHNSLSLSLSLSLIRWEYQNVKLCSHKGSFHLIYLLTIICQYANALQFATASSVTRLGDF